MSRRLTIAAAGTASAAAIFVVTAALAAYGSPRLHVSHGSGGVTIDVAQNPADDPTAIARVISPIGTRVAAPPAGATIGGAEAELVETASVTRLTAQGEVRVLGAGLQGAPSACTAGERVVSTWSASLTREGLALELPVYLVVGGDLLLCYPHPRTLERGAKLVGVRLTLTDALGFPTSGTWVSLWVPFRGDAADPSRMVASPAAVSVGSVTLTARTKGSGAVLVGFVRQGSAPRADARVHITGGARASAQRLLGTARTNRGGQFTFRARSGTYFRATAVVPRSSPPGLCFVLEPLLRPTPCVNPTLNGFTVQTPTVRRS